MVDINILNFLIEFDKSRMLLQLNNTPHRNNELIKISNTETIK